MISLPCHSFALFPFHSRSMSLFSFIFLDCFPDGSALSINCRPPSPFCYPPSSSINTLLISLFLLFFSPLLSFLLIFPFFPFSLLPVLYYLLLFLLLIFIFSFSFSSCSYSSLPFFSDDVKYHRFTD